MKDSSRGKINVADVKSKKAPKKETKTELINKAELLSAMDPRYQEKKDIVPDILAEGFLQMEKLIKEQPVITVEDIRNKAIDDMMTELYEVIDEHGTQYVAMYMKERAKRLKEGEVIDD